MKKILFILLFIPCILNAITPTFTCGFECGISTPLGGSGSGVGHLLLTTSNVSFSTTTFRNGARALRVNTSASSNDFAEHIFSASSNIIVFRFYIRFATLPNATIRLCVVDNSGAGNDAGAYFNSSDNKIYPGYSGTPTLGSTGVSVTTGVWYRVDVKVNVSANPWTIDVQVDGTATTQLTKAVASTTFNRIIIGNNASGSSTEDMFYDDLVTSATSGDYPIGKGYVSGYTVGSDGTHSGITANDYERTLTGTDITNSSTDAYQLIDDMPLESSAGDFINMVAPVASSYVECVINASASQAPRGVEIIVGFHQAGTGTGTMEILLNDNGSTASIYTASLVAGTTNLNWRSVHFTDPPSAAGTWTLSGNGNFNAIRIRFGATGTVDANPDQYLDGVIFEAEFDEPTALPRRVKLISYNRFNDFKNHTK